SAKAAARSTSPASSSCWGIVSTLPRGGSPFADLLLRRALALALQPLDQLADHRLFAGDQRAGAQQLLALELAHAPAELAHDGNHLDVDLRVLQRRQLAQHHLGIADVEAGAGERGADAQHAIEADLQQVLQRRSGALDVRIDPRPRLLEALQRVGNALG